MGWSEQNRTIDLRHTGSSGAGHGRYNGLTFPEASRYASAEQRSSSPSGGHGRYDLNPMEPVQEFSDEGHSQSSSMDACSAIPMNCYGQSLCFERDQAPHGCHPEPVQHAICVNMPSVQGSVSHVGTPKTACGFRCVAGYREAYCGPACVMCAQDVDRYTPVIAIALWLLTLCALIMLLQRSFGMKLRGKRSRMLLDMNCPAIPAAKRSTCCICLCTMECGDSVRQLPCLAGGFDAHQFHSDCIDRWLENTLRCPLCNADCSALVQFQFRSVCRKLHASAAAEPCSETDTDEFTPS
eukprot:TRINITY_DN7869_c0_g1_i1.p1 TRINITY_DN7869_c0_g1~~TRINITY_DN7869_c0_g1_i1.p1  ORF type:complete len:296 (+),score=20.80 TRINITY_DN7869_c0_g1_i1:138-1025(+)